MGIAEIVRRPLMSIRHAVAGTLVVAGAVLLSGCATSTAASAPVAGSAIVNGTAHADAGSASTSAITVGTPPNADLQRSVRAAYTVPSGAFLTSFDGVIARAVGLGGYVASSATQPARDGRIVSGSVTLQIPATDIASFLNGMPSTFTASGIDFSSVDHTAQFVDVNAELASAHAQLHALDALLANATSLADITTLEQQIETVQVQVDTDQGELNGLTASVEMATATIVLSERGAPQVEAAVPGPLSTGVSGGWHNAVLVAGIAVEVLITAIPLLVIVALALAVWRWMPRRLRRTPRPTA
jgi:hypothetical protein